MKKLLIIVLVATLFVLGGCGQAEKSDIGTLSEYEKATSAMTDSEIADCIEESIYANYPSDLYVLLATEWLFVYVHEGEANISIRTLAYYEIPYVAQDMLPVVQEAVSEYDVEIGRFSVQSYNENNGGIIDGTMSSWSTTNEESGIYVSESDGSRIANATIEDLLKYYADYDEFIKDLRSGKYD